jgi:HPt (histidine-containing phosphotransfer) domain-containing protein
MAQAQPAFDASTEPIDKDVIRELRSLDEPGEGSFFSSLVAEFSSEGARLLAGVHQAVEGGDAMAMRNFAHSLKGSSGSMGATGLAKLCSELEGFGRHDDMLGAKRMLPLLQNEWNRVIKALQCHLNE